MIYDIAVIGLGPAGCTFCATIDKKYSVIALDKKNDTPTSFQKPCGGLLAPDAQKILSHMDVNLPKDVLVDPQIFSVKTVCLDSGEIRNYRRVYINLDRHKFDMWMQKNLPENITVQNDSTVTDLSYDGETYHVDYLHNGEHKTVSARILVGADGAKSAVRKMLYPNKKLRTYMAIQQWFTENNPKPFYSCIFDSENTDCCSWSISKDGCFIFGGAYPLDGSRKRFESQKKKLEAIGFVFGEPIKTEACLVLRPRSPLDILSGRKKAFLIGEAAGLISPSSLEGISYAAESAYSLASALNKDVENAEKIYSRAITKQRIRIFEKLFKCPFMYVPFLRKWVMKSGLMTIKPYRKKD